MTTGVLTTSFPRDPGDFAGCFVEDCARACADAGEFVEVIAAAPAPRAPEDVGDGGGSGDPTGRRGDLAPRISVWRVATPRLPASARGGALFFGAGAPETLESAGLAGWVQAGLFWAGLCERLRERAPSWRRIVAHWLVPSALAARAVAPHLPLTAYAHSGDVALLERIPGGASIARKLARETDDLIFVSANLRDRFARLSGSSTGRVAEIPARRGGAGGLVGGATRRRLLGDARSGPRAQGRPLLLSVGRLVPIKGFDVLLRAVATVGAGVLTVVILGEGPERARLEALARRRGIELHLPGCVPREEVARWMTLADLYVQPSRPLANGRTEGRPTATLEALQAGLPVIVSDTGGLGELAGVDTVAPDDPSALARALARYWRAGVRGGV